MEEEITKEGNQPSSSKKDTRENSRNDLYDDRDHDEHVSNSETSVSATYSARSRVDVADARPVPPQPTLGKKEPKASEKKRRGKRGGGRVEKRSYTRRQVRRAPRKKPHYRRGEKKYHNLSVSTIVSRRSYRARSRTPVCDYCGHRCCRRRYENEKRKWKERRHKRKKMAKQKITKSKKLKKKLVAKSRDSKQIQIGSRSHMLSPLFINTNSTPKAEMILPKKTYCDISPQMIFEALRNLTLWRQNVQTILILNYIKMNYPVNNVESELLVELKEKLRIATIVGIVVQSSEDCWSLSFELKQRKLTANHVTLFWQAYADTLSPITREQQVLQIEKTENQTNTQRGPDFGDDLI